MFGSAKITNNYTAPTVATWGYPHMDLIFPNDADYPLWLTRSVNASSITDWNLTASTLSGAVGPFTYIGGIAYTVTHSMSAIARGGNNTDILAIGTGGRNLYQKFRNNGPWGPDVANWFAVDGTLSSRKTMYSPPGVGTWSQNRVDIFALGQGGELWQYYYDAAYNGWNGWEAFGGNFLLDFAPTVASWGSGRYDLFLVCANNTLGYKYFDGAWSPSQASTDYYNLGGQLTSRPNVVIPEVGRMDVFARGGDAGLWHLKFDGKWGKWNRLGGSNDRIVGDPAAAVLGNKIYVVAQGEDNSLIAADWNWKQETAASANFTKLADGLVGAPTMITDNVNIEVFARLQGNRIGWKYFSGGRWNPIAESMAGLWQF